MNVQHAICGLGSVLAVVGCTDSKSCDRVGDICTIVGNGSEGYDGDQPQPALDTPMALPIGTRAALGGGLYVDDLANRRIRELTPDGKLEWIVGDGMAGDPSQASDMLVDPISGTLYMAARSAEILVVDTRTHSTSVKYGTGQYGNTGDGGPARLATFMRPSALAMDTDGDLAILDQAAGVIRSVDPSGTIRRIAGCVGCAPGYSGDGGPALAMRMGAFGGDNPEPAGRMVFDDVGDLYFADTANQVIRMIDSNGIVLRVAGTPPQSGSAGGGYAGDSGPAVEAELYGPTGLTIGDDGTLYIADTNNNCIRAVAPDQTIRTVAGICGKRGYHGDGGPATSALLEIPFGVEWTAPGILIIADTGNNVVRAVRLR